MTDKELLADNGYEDVVVFENFSYDGCLIGVTSDNRAIYSFSKMVEWLIKNEEFTEEEAVEWIDYNTIRACNYIKEAPIVMFDLIGGENIGKEA